VKIPKQRIHLQSHTNASSEESKRKKESDEAFRKQNKKTDQAGSVTSSVD
jgi:hypothetical protein